MSKLEEKIISELANHKVDYEVQVPVPLENYPWKTDRTKTPPKSDIYLPEFDIYIEVKGFMTYRAVSKLSFLARQDYKYYIFQGTEPQWNPFIDSYLKIPIDLIKTQKGQMDFLIDFQIDELVKLKSAPDLFLKNISDIALKRLKDYMTTKINEYKNWNGEWY